MNKWNNEVVDDLDSTIVRFLVDPPTNWSACGSGINSLPIVAIEKGEHRHLLHHRQCHLVPLHIRKCLDKLSLWIFQAVDSMTKQEFGRHIER